MTITTEKTREIIRDFAEEIRKKRVEASPVESTRIEFRDGIAQNREEIVYKVPLELLRFRKENGRISSLVKTHERLIGRLDPADSEAQDVLRCFLREKDPEKTDELKQLLLADGQREPGIITADGFLINGNRRKVALEELRDKYSAEDSFHTMKVVILPDENEEGGPPSLREIEQIENRYQLQTDGKAEYSGFDAALSIRDKEASGYTLEQQMRDDPQYRLMEEQEFKRAVRKRKKETLEPLEYVEDYLDSIGKSGEFSAISKGLGDREGRWQAFRDLSEGFCTRAKKEQGLQKMGIDEREAGEIMQAAYTVIRMREVPGFGKLHQIMRSLPKYAEHGKKSLVELAKNVKHELSTDETTDENGVPLPLDAMEEKWQSKYREEVTRRLVKARDSADWGSEKNAPIALLDDALKKLNHENMVIDKIELDLLDTALTRANDVESRIKDLRREIYERVKTAGEVRRILKAEGKK